MTTPSPYGRLAPWPKLVERCRASSSSSTNEPSSSSSSIRSRAVFLPSACCFSTARAEPAWTASSARPLEVGELARGGVDAVPSGVGICGGGHVTDVQRTFRGPRRGGRRIVASLPVVDSTMGEYLNSMTLLGVGLIMGGFGLLVCAVSAAEIILPARHRRPASSVHRLDRLARTPTRTGRFTPGVAPPVVREPRQPHILRSALLADTMWLNQVSRQNLTPGRDLSRDRGSGGVVPGGVVWRGSVFPDGPRPRTAGPAR